MAKVIAAMNMTLDGFCDHTSMIADEEIHQHYTEILRDADTIIYGSPSLIVQLGNLGLIDEYQLGVQTTVIGSGLPLFKNITDRIDLILLKTKTFGCGAVFLYYEPTRSASA